MKRPRGEPAVAPTRELSSREHAARLLAAPAALVQLSLVEAKIVVSYMRPEKVPAGVTFITEGDADNTGFMVLLLDGEVVVESITVSRTHPVTTAMLGPGSLVGEMGLLDTGPAVSVLHCQYRHPVCGVDPPGAGIADRRATRHWCEVPVGGVGKNRRALPGNPEETQTVCPPGIHHAGRTQQAKVTRHAVRGRQLAARCAPVHPVPATRNTPLHAFFQTHPLHPVS